jgi:hypothetical protein
MAIGKSYNRVSQSFLRVSRNLLWPRQLKHPIRSREISHEDLDPGSAIKTTYCFDQNNLFCAVGAPKK